VAASREWVAVQRAKDSRVFEIIVTEVPCKTSALLSGVVSPKLLGSKQKLRQLNGV
jgi:hypothetical protein